MSIKIIAKNKKAFHDYLIVDTFESGIQLLGSEVKSLRAGNITLKDSYISFSKNEAFLQNAHISEYLQSSYNNHKPERLRKLLLHRNELDNIEASLKEKGLACIPLKIYFKRGKVKLELGLGKGKSHGDKREASRKRDATREIQRTLRHSK